MDTTGARKTYRGNCHCGRFVFELSTAEPITELYNCNCSICVKKGYLWRFVGADDVFTVVQGDDALAEYTFGKGVLIHKVRQPPAAVAATVTATATTQETEANDIVVSLLFVFAVLSSLCHWRSRHHDGRSSRHANRSECRLRTPPHPPPPQRVPKLSPALSPFPRSLGKGLSSHCPHHRGLTGGAGARDSRTADE